MHSYTLTGLSLENNLIVKKVNFQLLKIYRSYKNIVC